MPSLSLDLPSEQAPVFELRVRRAVLGGALAGGAHALWTTVAAPLVPLAVLCLAGATLAAWPGSTRRRIRGAVIVLATLTLDTLITVQPTWRLVFAAAALGALWCRAHLADIDHAWAKQSAKGWIHPTMTAIGVSLLALAGARISWLLGQSLEAWGWSSLLVALAGGAVLGLFCGLGTVPAYLVPPLDSVEVELERLIPTLRGELSEATGEALTRYRQCALILSLLPREPTREELARTLTQTTREVTRLASEWAKLEALLSEVDADALERRIAALHERAFTATDPLARKQLEGAAEALVEGRGRAAMLVEQRERVHAKLHASVALLEAARLALLGTRGGETQIKATELAAVSERLKALVSAQGEDARWVDALATGAELAAVEARERVQ